MTITCQTMREMLDVISGLVERGIGFEADTRYFIVTLTGAH